MRGNDGSGRPRGNDGSGCPRGIGGPASEYGPAAIAHLLALFGLPPQEAGNLALRCPDWGALAEHLRREHGVPAGAGGAR